VWLVGTVVGVVVGTVVGVVVGTAVGVVVGTGDITVTYPDLSTL